MGRIDSIEQLEALYRAPLDQTRAKKKPRLDDGLRAALALSPFALLATADSTGRCDVSPRGGPPGFVKPLDDGRVAVPDLNGNNLLDSLRNIVLNPKAALLVLIPGQNETMRIDGAAHLSTDDDLLARFTDELRQPTLAVVIEIETVFTHCAKSFRRGGLWDPTSWPHPKRPPMLDARYRQLNLERTFEEYAASNERVIRDDLAADKPM